MPFSNAFSGLKASGKITIMQLSKLGEFGLIETIRSSFVSASPKIIKGIGDDAAAIKTSEKITLFTTDMLLEGVHFSLSFTTFYQLGHKVLAVNISDIFAMGGKPKYFLIGLGIPKNYSSENIGELYSGINDLSKKFGINVIGGDTCASKKGLVISGTLIGETDKIISRSGARPGNGIFITNTLGDSAMGLRLLKKLKRKIYFEKRKQKNSLLVTRYSLLIRQHLMPEPQPLNHFVTKKQTNKITSMIDISDGLLIDLSHICDESNVGARIYMDKIPLSRGLVETTKKLGMDPMNFALKGGEDYALLFTAKPDIKTTAFKIGEIIPKGRFIVDTNGREKPLKPEGYEHFKRKFKI
ncbi:MAG: thiamine-phosphate kinase [Nitrospirae bacterium]|nr:thiamine-phosphate kinase [Nitrospirota bacterium]